MNKDLIDQLTAEEQPVAERLSTAAEHMKLSPGFQSNLETQLMDQFSSHDGRRTSFVQFLKPLAWATTAVAGILVASWVLRTLLPGVQPAAEPTAIQEVSFAQQVRQGNICTGTLAGVHGFAVFLTNPEKTQFIVLDEGKTVGEFRSFVWSADGQQLAILGNTTGHGKIYITDTSASQLESGPDYPGLGYLMSMAWSRDGSQFITWSGQNNAKVYVLDADGSSMTERELDVYINGPPQFAPDGKSFLFYGSNAETGGLWEASLESSDIKLISPLVEDETGFAFSQDGSHLAFLEMDRTAGEARLVSLELVTGTRRTLGTLSIPKGLGSSIPEAANMSWSADEESLVFDIGRGAGDRAIYLALADGDQLYKLVDSGYAPTISADGQCLAYIKNKQVFLLDITAKVGNTITAAPVLLADLPPGRGTPYFELDQLRWSPEP